ncbi:MULTISPECIES: replicative DNA helicase [unclassified Tolypothrix]|uniref:replicative DNA helicase n=1 Tax=unclassified Tolypothrix TaxID=2649714 RepID=UPI0005EAACBA|nr:MULTISPECIES: replicative DNA helicase [unclassified Tolypothrix]BAY90976.1 replicative DNA helicase [Microchaete diplosiphon NIES-3275]EKE99775.1 replicative DNA helicase DnaB [Tolypothrix sp. PCC 7601]MBE9082496.1 replicative DNA helicase [Tolypothrix sp. LEGE 11397]UYD25083.1 replicative DNA helicase [Tolypothrix sp. PCC 7712]UYD32679.1 replicative DNA helicase [Tolypothrix sp. PCC 7601]
MAEELSFQGNGSDRLPPQNIEAEEAILGGILLDPEAIGRVSDRLVAEAFYISAHKDIYQAALRLHAQGKPTDLLAVTSWLADHDLLNRIGGRNKLATLVDRTVSAVNIDALASLVMDKYQRRQLIKAGNEIVHLGYETEKELPIVLDQAEQKVFGITQERAQSGLVHISDTLISNFQDIEERNQGIALPGITCSFYDLDALTSGFQRSDLIIVAARPAMGKTAFCLNLAYNIAASHRMPVAVFSLEMSKEQLVQRLLASEAGIESGYLRSGRLSQAQWEPLSRAIGMLSEMPIFIDDTPNITVTQMRSQARRLQAEQGMELGLIVIDYLQLMEGAGDNRVQELSKITRSLKGLARELSVPVIALSQLSRGVEARTNKRPMLSDLRESGCLTGDTLVTLADTGVQVPIRNLVGKSGFSVLALNEATMQLEKAIVSNAFSTGVKPIFLLKTRLGRKIRATGNHKFLTINGWKRLDSLEIGDRLALPMQSLADVAHCGTTLYKQNVSRERASRLATVVKSAEINLLANSDIYWDEIVAIQPDGEEEVYDLTVPNLHNFIANNIIVHNSIEQDADLVIMLYRDDYYNNDSPDRGIAEVIVAKHRNGPTGTVKLLFDPQFTKFKNLARPNNY